jgi:hypothetical protein
MMAKRRPLLRAGADNDRGMRPSSGLLRAARRDQHRAGRSSKERSSFHVLRSTFSGRVGSKLAFLTQPIEHVPEFGRERLLVDQVVASPGTVRGDCG